MARINVKEIAEGIREELRAEISTLDIKPRLSTVLVGNDGASIVYVRNKEKVLEEIGAEYATYKLPQDITESRLIEFIEALNEDESTHGILLQLLLPSHINTERVLSRISPLKDVDGFNGGAIPCTPLGILKIFQGIGYDLRGKNVLLIGRGKTVGAPLLPLLVQHDATVLNIHSKSKPDRDDYIKNFNPSVIISATGVKGLLSKSNIPDSLEVLIDAGITRELQANGKYRVFGDYNAEHYKYLDYLDVDYTYRLGGVGAMTTTMLAYNLLDRYRAQRAGN